MTWAAIWRTDTGELIELVENVPDPFLFGRSVTRFAEKPEGTWNRVTHIFDPLPYVRATVLTRLAFLQRMTPQERIAIRTAAKVDPVAEDFIHMLDIADDVGLDHPDTIAGLGYCEAMGYIGSGRAAAIRDI